MKNVTPEEMNYLVNSIINTARYLEKDINLDDITPEYLERELKLYRSINHKFKTLLKNSNEVNSGRRDRNNILDGVLTCTK